MEADRSVVRSKSAFIYAKSNRARNWTDFAALAANGSDPHDRRCLFRASFGRTATSDYIS